MIYEQNKQLTFLKDDTSCSIITNCDNSSSTTLKIYIDGAARNNPGPSGAGISFMRDQDIIFEQGFFIGTRTNNQAEYLALLIACCFMQEYAKPGDQIVVYSDSQLLIRQMNGVYKIRDPFLQKVHAIIVELLTKYKVFFCHVYREHNTRADLMANRGIDKKVPLPKKIKDFIQRRGII